MRLTTKSIKELALTLTEVLCVVVAVLFLGALALTFVAKDKGSPIGKQCGDNLRMIALALKLYEADHDDKFPVPATNSPTHTNDKQAWRHFQMLGPHYLGSEAWRLTCPQDSNRLASAVTTFDSSPSGLPSKGNRALSYFIGLDADGSRPHSLLAGDRNLITNRHPLTAAMLVLSNNVLPGWTQELHTNAGNFIDASGDLHSLSNPGLRTRLPFAVESATNRLLLPLVP